MSLKPTADLKDTDVHRFVVQIEYKDTWVDANWILYTRTLKPFEPHRINIYGMVGFTDAEIAVKAAKAIGGEYSEHLRVIDRNIITEETFVREIK